MRATLEAVWFYLLTSLIAVCGVLFGHYLVKSQGTQPGDLVAALARSDSLHYMDIVTRGYRYDPEQRSEVAYFPTYPTAAWLLSRVSGLDPMRSLLVISNVFLVGSFLVLGAYVRGRRFWDPHAGSGRADCPAVARSAGTSCLATRLEKPLDRQSVYSDRTLWATLLIFGLLPPTFFFRMAYSESTFLFFCILSFHAMVQGWPILSVAVLVGLTTACRPVGVALLLPLLIHLQRSSRGTSQLVVRCLTLLPVACWGLAAFMLFQYVEFGNAFAFVQTQQHWAFHAPTGAFDKWLALLSWEPIWSTYDPAYPGYWKNYSPPWLLFNWQFISPIYFVATAFLVGLGAWRRWLSSGEVLLSVGLLAIPYITKAHEFGMSSHGRYAAAVFPVYLVAGRLLAALPPAVSVGILVLSGFFMGVYASMFAAGYLFF